MSSENALTGSLSAASEVLDSVPGSVRTAIEQAAYILLRFETEYTQCTGITAVTKQERRHFARGVMIAPWFQGLRRSPEHDPLKNGKIIDTGWAFSFSQVRQCRVLITSDGFMPTLYLSVDGNFEGEETPYDVPIQSLRMDALIFGLAVDALLALVGSSGQFVWGADWESVPALMRLRARHITALTLHNTFDECLEEEATSFGAAYQCFREQSAAHLGSKTALEVGIGAVDVVTTVNRGFAYGIRAEWIQTAVMAGHLQHLAQRVVGINNASFSPLGPEHLALRGALRANFAAGKGQLFAMKEAALDQLPDLIKSKAIGKTVVVSMGRRVAQKQHDVLVESTRSLLLRHPALPLLVVFATIHGDSGSPARLARMHLLAQEFPENVVCLDGRLGYYSQLMAAADYNCMPSLYEPHGAAYEGTVIPIARAIDGLAEQVCAFSPRGEAARINRLWHSEHEQPTGFLFRENTLEADQLIVQLTALLRESPSPSNDVFKRMVDELSEVLLQGISTRRDHPDYFARLVMGALEKQEDTTWQANLGGICALVEKSRAQTAVRAG